MYANWFIEQTRHQFQNRLTTVHLLDRGQSASEIQFDIYQSNFFKRDFIWECIFRHTDRRASIIPAHALLREKNMQRIVLFKWRCILVVLGIGPERPAVHEWTACVQPALGRGEGREREKWGGLVIHDYFWVCAIFLEACFFLGEGWGEGVVFREERHPSSSSYISFCLILH